MINVETHLLRLLCRPSLDTADREAIDKIRVHRMDETKFVHLAEKHGMAPLAYHHLNQLDWPISQKIRQQFIALKIRHRKANEARSVALETILSDFARCQIDAILLKGAALMYVLYDDISLRPMSDLDILVPPSQALQAQECLRAQGYQIHEQRNPYLTDHHHLPMASRTVQGISVHVEIHIDALSRDNSESIQFGNLQSDPVAFQINHQTAYRLGHIDSLRHLCHHTLEPVVETKLISVADVYGYADKYINQLDTERMQRAYPLIANTLTLFHYLSPLPLRLREWIEPPGAPAPEDVGKGFTPLSERRLSEKRGISKVSALFKAPSWWLHCFYVVAPHRSISSTRVIKHPSQVMKWLIRRWLAKHRAGT